MQVFSLDRNLLIFFAGKKVFSLDCNLLTECHIFVIWIAIWLKIVLR